MQLTLDRLPLCLLVYSLVRPPGFFVLSVEDSLDYLERQFLLLHPSSRLGQQVAPEALELNWHGLRFKRYCKDQKRITAKETGRRLQGAKIQGKRKSLEEELSLGYPKETMGYSFYYPPENKVLVARNAEFLENSLITQEASGSLKDLEIIQEEDTHPSIDTSLNHKEDGLEIDEPQSDIILIRRSTRTRNAPNYMCLYIDAEEYELGDLGEPANYKAALLDSEFDKWLNAMNVEMQSMKDNKV
ncbi:hypothetical protein Tco_1253965 [Tanacetum coccineum]